MRKIILFMFLMFCVSSLAFAGDEAPSVKLGGLLELDLHNNVYSIADSTVSFRQHQAVLFLHATSGEKIKGVFAPAFGYGGRDIDVWNAYVDYMFSPQCTLRFGVDLVPFGRWEVERISIHERDLRIRPNMLYKGLFSHTAMGVYALGSFETDYGDIVYRIGAINNEDIVDKKLTLREDTTNGKTVVGRIGVDTPYNLNAGVSFYSGQSFNNKVKVSDKTLYGADLTYRVKRLKLAGEYISGSIQPVAGNSYKGLGYYMQAGYMLTDKVTASYRYDKNDKNDSAASDSMDEGIEHLLGVSFRPEPNYVLFFDYRVHTSEKATKRNKFIFSIGLTF